MASVPEFAMQGTVSGDRDKLGTSRGGSDRPGFVPPGIGSDPQGVIKEFGRGFRRDTRPYLPSGIPAPTDSQTGYRAGQPVLKVNVLRSDEELFEKLREYQNVSDSIVARMLQSECRSDFPEVIEQHRAEGLEYVKNIVPIYEEGYELTSQSIGKMLSEIYLDNELLTFCYKRLENEPAELPDALSSRSERLQRLARYAAQFGGEGLIEYAILLFPELSIEEVVSQEMREGIDLPRSAPELWADRTDKQEKPPGFVKRVYGPWLGKGFTRATLRHLDPPLAQAMTNWLRHNQMPSDVDLPTLKEQNTRWVERVQSEGLAAVLPEGSPQAVLREARRLTALKHRRSRTPN